MVQLCLVIWLFVPGACWVWLGNVTARLGVAAQYSVARWALLSCHSKDILAAYAEREIYCVIGVCSVAIIRPRWRVKHSSTLVFSPRPAGDDVGHPFIFLLIIT